MIVLPNEITDLANECLEIIVELMSHTHVSIDLLKQFLLFLMQNSSKLDLYNKARNERNFDSDDFALFIPFFSNVKGFLH